MEQLLTPRDVADRCQLSTKTVLRAIHAGRLRASRLGDQAAFRIRPADVEAWVDASVVDPQSAVVRRLPPAPPAPSPDARSSIAGDGRLVVEPDMGRPSAPVRRSA